MSSRYSLTKRIPDADKRVRALKEYYQNWRDFNSKAKYSFTAIENSFFTGENKLLRELDSGALRLYLYFCHVANNDYGHSWHSISRIAEYFNKDQTRTIDNWIKTLVDKDLIYRAPTGQKSYTTYLIPYSNTLITHPAPRKRNEDNQELLDDLIAEIRSLEFLYGEIVKVYHLFQWTVINNKPINPNNSKQVLLIITRRKNGILIGHVHTLRKSDHLSVNELNIEEHSFFDSPFLYEGDNVVGIALNPFPVLKSRASIKDTIEWLPELADIEEWELKDRQKLLYGKKDELLPADSEMEKEEASEQERDEDVTEEEK